LTQSSIAHRLAYIAVGIILGSVVLVPTRSDRSPAAPAEKRDTGIPTSLGPIRLTEGQVSGQAAYATYPTPVDWESADKVRLLREWARQEEDGSLTPRDRAMLLLAQGKLDAAIHELEVALQLSPGDAALLSDLSALYGERGDGASQSGQDHPRVRGGISDLAFWSIVTRHPDDCVTALELAEEAVSIDPDLPAAVFNQAVALERMFLDQQAVDAWRRYLELDGTSPWAGEARQRVYRLDNVFRAPENSRERMNEAIFRGYQETIVLFAAGEPQTAREIFEEDLLPRWAEAITSRDQELANVLRAGARDIAEQFTLRSAGDRIFQQVVAEMATIAADPLSRQRASSLVRYFRSRAELGTAIDTGTTENAVLAEVDRALETSSSPLGMLVRFRRAESLYWRGKHTEASAELRRLGQDPRLVDYPSLEARRQHLLGLIAQRQDALTDAVAAYRRAIDLYTRIGEQPNAAATQTLIAICLDSLGQPAEAWNYRYRALAWSRKRPAHSHLPIAVDLLETGVAAALSQRRPKVALCLQHQMVILTYAMDAPEEIVRALLGHARIEAALTSQEKARRDFSQALEELRRVPPSARARLAGQIDVTRTEIEESDNRSAKIAWELGTPDQLAAQADFYFEQGKTAAAENYLRRALDELDRQRAKVESGEWEYQVSFLDQARPFYDRMVALQLHLAEPEQALATLERFRARALFDRWQRLSAEAGEKKVEGLVVAPLSWQEMSRQVPANTVIVIYGVVEERLVTWVVRRSKIEVIPQQPEWSKIAPLVDELRKNKRRELLSMLYQEFVAPWKNKLTGGERIIFVPASSLYNVPFAALLNVESGRFLIQDHVLGIASSASEFLGAVARDRRLSARPLTEILLVGDPSSSDPYFSRLPGAKREIAALAAVYDGLNVRSLTQSEATPGHVLSGFGKADVVHLAVHGLGNREDPDRAFLKLSPDGDSPGELTARDILGLRLNRTRLVVLSSCETQAGRVSDSEGSLNLTYALLAAGSPAAVGSLWHVDDESTARLFIRFHQELRRGADAASALRTAQLEELANHSYENHWTWASFQVFGGVSARNPG
jgi:CHAT domain-containing protein